MTDRQKASTHTRRERERERARNRVINKFNPYHNKDKLSIEAEKITRKQTDRQTDRQAKDKHRERESKREIKRQREIIKSNSCHNKEKLSIGATLTGNRQIDKMTDRQKASTHIRRER